MTYDLRVRVCDASFSSPSAMAGAQYAVASFLPTSANNIPIPRKPVVLASITTPPSPSKLSKRKNYLRPKLLKTLKKPYPTPLLPQDPPTNPKTPSHQIFGDSYPDVAGEHEEAHEFHLSETSDTAGASNTFSTRSVFEFALYFTGLFVFQTICAVWVLGSSNSDHKDGNVEGGDKSRVLESRTSNVTSLLNESDRLSKPGGSVHVDEFLLEEKIVEIRAMAREVRQSEGKKLKANGLDLPLDCVNGTGIKKEVNGRLIKLQKRLNSIWEKSSLSYLSKFGKVEDSSNTEEVNKALVFKKKYKFRSPSMNSRNDPPKGFQRSEDRSVSKKKNSSLATIDPMPRSASAVNNGLESLDREQQLDLHDGNLRESTSQPLEEDAGRKPLIKESKPLQSTVTKLEKERERTKLRKEMGVENTEQNIGVVQESSHGRPSVEAAKSRESSELETRNSQSFTKENQDTITVSKKHAVLSRNGNSTRRKVESRPANNKVRDKRSHIETDLWWLNLPYVLAILLRRGSDDEAPQGFYTLKTASHTQDQSDSSYTVAFEDRGDANNFCYLLETFFAELDDISVDIVPLSIKELNEAVKSHTMKVIVVKKGQLQLYAGQPLADVEVALRSLVKPN